MIVCQILLMQLAMRLSGITNMLSNEVRKNWRPFLNVMQRLNMDLDVMLTCLQQPVCVELGRKELYELKRDWHYTLEVDDKGNVLRVKGILVVALPVTEHLKVL